MSINLPRWSVLLMISLAVCAIFHQTLAGMVAIWDRSETYAHGYVIIPISAWLVYRMRDRLEALPVSPSPVAIPLIILLSIVWVMARSVDILVIEQFAFVALWIASVWLLMGNRITWAMIFPLCYLFMAVPVGDELVPMLIDHTAVFTIGAIRLTGIPIYAEGNHFVIPTGRWSVVDACSGIRYLLASITIGLLFAYLNYQTWWRRVLFVLASIAVPIIANWLRAFGIVMLGYFSNNKLATGVDHIIYGWLFFGIVIFILFSIGMIWHEPEPETEEAEHSGNQPENRTAMSLPAIRYVLPLVLVLLSLPYLANRHLQQPSLPDEIAALPEQLDTWVQPSEPDACASGDCALFDWSPVFVGAGKERFAYYHKAGVTLGVHTAEYPQQAQGRELIAWQNRLLRPENTRWSRIGQEISSVDTAEGVVKVRQMLLQRNEQRLLLWQVYRIGDHFDGRKLPQKFQDAINRVVHGNSAGSSVVIAAPFMRGEQAPKAGMQSLLRALINAYPLHTEASGG